MNSLGSNRRFALFIICASYSLVFAHRIAVVPFYDEIMRRYGVGYAYAGMLMTVFALLYAIFLIPSGMLADKSDPGMLLALAILAMGVGGIWFSRASSYFGLLASRALIGLGGAFVYSPSVKILANNYGLEERGQAIGIMEASAAMGMLFSLTLLPVFAQKTSFSMVFGSFGAVAFVVFLGAITLRGSKPAHDSRAIKQRESYSIRQLVLLLLIAFTGMLAVYGVLGWLPSYITEGLGYSKSKSAFAMALVTGMIAVGNPIGGRISDVVKKRELVITFGAMVVALGFIGLILVPGGWGVYAIGAILGMGISCSVTPLTALVTDIFGPTIAGSLAGAVNTSGQVASSISGYGYGFILDKTGDFRWIFGISAVAMLIRIILVFVVSKTSRKTTAS